MSLEDYRTEIETCFGCSCNFCERGCPIYQIKKVKIYTSRGRNRIILGLLSKKVKPSKEMAEVCFQCTMCGNCERWCALPDTKIFRALREYLIEKGFENTFHKKNIANIKRFENPYGKVDKYSWRKGLNFSRDSKTLFFAGCTMPLKNAETLRKAVKILGLQNLRVMENEACCGSYPMRTGYAKEYQKLCAELINFIQKEGIREVITPCPGCYSAIKEAIVDNKLNVKVLHITEKIVKMLKSGELKLKKLFGKITYHDPCHLGRLGGVFDAPRQILVHLGDLVEMKNSKYESFCCGAGGGVKAAFPELSTKIGKKRIEDAKATGASILVTACPFCENQFKSIGGLKVKDIIELVGKAMR